MFSGVSCCAFIVQFGRSPNAELLRVQLDFGGVERVLLWKILYRRKDEIMA